VAIAFSIFAGVALRAVSSTFAWSAAIGGLEVAALD